MAFIGAGLVNQETRARKQARASRCPVVSMYSFGTDVQTEQKCAIKVEQKNGAAKQIEAKVGTNLRTALRENGVDIYTLGGKLRNCGGNGACGLCTVDVADGQYNLTPMGPKEEFMMNGKPM
eukprot:CAMPEP_0185837388 /NCGR_PEP_ID=MMETSP1353-20130828/11308_1 /TAXON_ID=1077150 /ORGANISM="Erythrolobus australicus, Strain CCMP3124" /LENGTH=121 /DNA_ID=CAMNT_0028536295 /DNA_START=195 /DNA_END=557 /DNA_ORIENTATION=-